MAKRPNVKFSTTDLDLGMKHILKEAKKLAKKPYVKIGLQGQSGLKPKKGKNKNLANEFTVVDVGTVHEYGSPERNIPERSFIRSTVTDNAPKYFVLASQLRDQILDGKIKLTTEKALKKLGLVIESDIKGKFDKNNWPSLKDPTRGGKNLDKESGVGDAKPLLDTGQLRNSITTKAVMDGTKKD